MERLTINKAQELLGKLIQWSAPSAEGNTPYGGYAIIDDIKASNKPIVATILDGDNLNLAICVDGINVDFSDYGRGVTYKIVMDKAQWEEEEKALDNFLKNMNKL